MLEENLRGFWIFWEGQFLEEGVGCNIWRPCGWLQAELITENLAEQLTACRTAAAAFSASHVSGPHSCQHHMAAEGKATAVDSSAVVFA